MSKNRFPWWGYIKQILYRYPRCADFERAAVAAALEETRVMESGEDRSKIIDLVFFKKTHKLAGAAMQIPCSYQTAKVWQQDFIRAVAAQIKCNGLLKD